MAIHAASHPDVAVTHPDKLIWKNPPIQKAGYLSYLVQTASRMLPFLEDKTLTVIRYPNGVPGDSFFQKHFSDNLPDFVQTVKEDEENRIICNNLSTLAWLGNQAAVEFHIPFQTAGSEYPDEIVFDLDPPDRRHFPWAVHAAREMKQLFDRLSVKSYPKLSGSRGIQIHLPLHRTRISYAETRLFTSFVATVLTQKFPLEFTTERLKKNRHGRLYIDYVQHAPGKTIICPYSARGKEGATVAAPLRWEEVTDQLQMEKFTIPFMLNRISSEPCPMTDYFQQSNPSLMGIIATLKAHQTAPHIIS
jgi:bifunctional non-homologous end joining protein LigD